MKYQNLLIISFLILVPALSYSQVYFSDDFESGLDQWVVSGQDWDTTSASFSSSNHSVTDSPDGNYAPNTDVRLTMQSTLDLTSSTNPVLAIWQSFYTENTRDYCRVEISQDGGFNWTELAQFTGGNRSWSYIQIDISEYRQPNILVRFRLTSNGPASELDGWYLDDVEIREPDNLRTSYPFSDDFETGLGNWLAGDQGWDTTSTSFASTNHSITDSPEGNHPYYANTHLLLAHPIDLSNTTSPVLSFWEKYYTERSYDICHVDISTDGGFNWVELEQYSGGNRSWRYKQYDLSEYKSTSVLIRFRITANGSSTQLDGWYIDNVEIKEFDSNRITFPFADNFESSLDNWLYSDQGWNTTTTSYAGNNYSITDSPLDNYPYYANTQLILAHPIDLSNTSAPVLYFWQKFYTEGNYDICRIDISQDGGFTWNEIEAFSGGNRSWSQVQIDLSSYKSDVFQIRFRLTANASSTQLDGWYIDNVEIKELDNNYTPFPFSDNFENGLVNWLNGAQDWDTTSTSFVSADHSITDSPIGKYPYYANTHLVLAHPMDLSASTQPVLTYWQKYDTEANRDYCRVEISTDAGFNWQEITSYHGTNSAWHQEQFDLSTYKDSQVLVRFRITSNGSSTEGDGWHLDNIEIFDLSGNRAPSVDLFTSDPLIGAAPLNVTFEAEGSDTDGTITGYLWDFDGDGMNDDTTGTGINSYIYQSAGIYNATCRVTDDQGASSAPAIIPINVYSDAMRMVSVPDDSASVDATFILPIIISDVAGIAGAEFNLDYDPAILTATDVNTTNLTSGFTATDSISNGSVAISMARATGLTSGSGDFVNITFHVSADALNKQTSDLTLEQVSLFDADTNPIEVSTIDGLFTVKSGTTVTESIQYIFIDPGLDTLEINQTALYSAYAVDSEDNVVEIDVTWTHAPIIGIPGGISPSIGHSTVYTATGIGDGFIAAEYTFDSETFTDTAYVIVGEMKGDINIDQVINVPDAILCLQIAAAILAPSPYQGWSADYNDTYDINSADAIGILTESLNNLLPKIGPTLGMLTSQTGSAVIFPAKSFSKSSDVITVSIFTKNRLDICGMDLKIDYNRSKFNLVDISPGKTTTLLVQNLEENRISTVNLNGLPDESGELITLHFQRINSGESNPDIDFTSLDIFDQNGNMIDTQVELNHPDPVLLPSSYSLHQNFPNPFNPSTTIIFDLPEAGEVNLSVYSITGQLISQLVTGNRDAGSYSVTWKGMDNLGHMVSSGVYYYKIVFNHGQWSAVKKMLFVK